jgi:hypothetical protein
MYNVLNLVEAKNGWCISSAYSLFLHQEAKDYGLSGLEAIMENSSEEVV